MSLEVLLSVDVGSVDFLFLVRAVILDLKAVVVQSESLDLDWEWGELLEALNDLLFVFNVFREPWVFLRWVRW